MAFWHLLIIILSFTSSYFIPASADTAFCSFEHTTTYQSDLITDHISGYLCALDLDIKGDRVDHIGGSHENGETNTQVDIIKVLKDFKTYLTSFPDTFCKHFEKLEIIDMSGTLIETIENDSLEKCKDLRILQFYMNNIKEVPEDLLKNNKKLLRLFISYNKIRIVPEDLLSGLSSLEILDLSYNKLEHLHSDVFRDLRNLKELNLEGNLIEILMPNLFKNLQNLVKMSLATNAISELPLSIFSNLGKLKELMLKNNQLTVIHAESFPQKTKINFVDYSKNRIEAIDEFVINNCEISKLKMGGNVCDKTMNIGKKDMKKKLKKCFDNYNILYGSQIVTFAEPETTTTTKSTTSRTKRTKQATTTELITSTNQKPTTTTSEPETTTFDKSTTTISRPTKKRTRPTTTKTTTTTTTELPTTAEPSTTEAIPFEDRSSSRVTKPIRTTVPPQLDKPKLKAVNEPCGIAKVGVPNIVGGEEISPNTHPWLAGLIYKGKFFCGGSIVTKRKVVTAAHCILAKGSTAKIPKDLTVILGGHRLVNPLEVGRVSTGVQAIEIHKDWNPNGQKFDADIAVLVLDEDITFNYYIQPVCLSEVGNDFLSYTDGIIVGYGKSERSKSHENVPIKANTPIHSNIDCHMEYPDLLNLASHRTFCGGFANGTGSCTGDSGGGLTVVSNKRHFLRGIVSASLSAHEYGCDVNSYSVFTDMRFFYGFVKNVTVNYDLIVNYD